MPERIAYAREPSKLPVVLSADEVVRFLEAIPSLKSRTALTTVYADGAAQSRIRATESLFTETINTFATKSAKSGLVQCNKRL